MNNEYEGTISGNGAEETRFNEISSDTLAAVRAWITRYSYGIVSDKYGNSFQCLKDGKSKIIVFPGTAFAYGYFGKSEQTEISFLNPFVTQYRIVYLEWNKSVVPNTFGVKVLNNYASSRILSTTFRRDVLSFMKTGVFQMPVAIVELGKSGIISVTDLRTDDALYPVYRTPLLKLYPDSAEYSDTGGQTNENGKIKNGVTAATNFEFDSSDKVAATKYVVKETTKNIKN